MERSNKVRLDGPGGPGNQVGDVGRLLDAVRRRAGRLRVIRTSPPRRWSTGSSPSARIERAPRKHRARVDRHATPSARGLRDRSARRRLACRPTRFSTGFLEGGYVSGPRPRADDRARPPAGGRRTDHRPVEPRGVKAPPRARPTVRRCRAKALGRDRRVPITNRGTTASGHVDVVMRNRAPRGAPGLGDLDPQTQSAAAWRARPTAWIVPARNGVRKARLGCSSPLRAASSRLHREYGRDRCEVDSA